MKEELMKKVQRRIKEDEKRLEMFVKEQHIRNKRKAKDNEFFLDFYKDAEKELIKGMEFIRNLEENPSIVFTEINDYLQSRKGVLFSIIKNWRGHAYDVTVHDLQVFFAYYANLHFQSWLKENNIKEPFEISIRNPNQYPSLFSVYYRELELLQFNLFESWYGVRNMPLTDEEFLKKHHQELDRMDKEIKEQEKRVELEIDRRDHPLKHYKGVKNFFAYLFINKKKLYEAFNRLVDKEKAILQGLYEDKIYLEMTFPKKAELNKKKFELIQMIVPFFEELNYKENKNKNSLY